MQKSTAFIASSAVRSIHTTASPQAQKCILASHRTLPSRTAFHRRSVFVPSFSPSRRHGHHNVVHPPSHQHQPPRASATAPPTPSTPLSVFSSFTISVIRTVISVTLILALQSAVSSLLSTLGWVFPAPLATMLLVLSSITLLRLFRLSSFVDSIIALLFSPAIAFLSRWLAVFFVPNLVMLPLAPPLPTADVGKLALFVPLAFLVTLITTAMACCALRAVSTFKTSTTIPSSTSNTTTAKTMVANSNNNNNNNNNNNSSGGGGGGPSNKLLFSLTATCATTFALCVRAATSISVASRIFALSATLLTFCIGQRLPKQVKLIFHPLVCCTLGTLALLKLLSISTATAFTSTLAAYYLRSPSSSVSALSGAGNMLSTLLGPAVVTFAFTVDKHRRLALSRRVEVVLSTLFISAASLLGTAFVARLVNLAVPSRLLLIPRTVTAPLAVPIAALIGADVGLTASVVALTGLVGANVGRALLSLFRLKDPVVRGLALGCSAHGLGTAAMAEESEALPFAALAMALVGVFSTILVAIVPFKALLLKVALGTTTMIQSGSFI